MITLDPTDILHVDRADTETIQKERQLEKEANLAFKREREMQKTRGKTATHKLAKKRQVEKERKKRVSLLGLHGFIETLEGMYIVIIISIILQKYVPQKCIYYKEFHIYINYVSI